jgi:2-polyprenyl-3-methyl-5-hydroxy-6-metoxy-1,4-benzoquinol methylase
MIQNPWNRRSVISGALRRADLKRPWYRYALELLRANADLFLRHGAVLDVGCGVGEFMALLREEGFEVEGIDGNEEQVRAVKSLGLRARLGDLERPLPYSSGSFSLVSCLELIEHIALAEILLTEIHRILCPGGCILLSTPNFAFINARLHYLLGSGPLNEGIHLRFFTKPHLESLLAGAGFGQIRRNSYGVIPILSTFTMRALGKEPVLWHVPVVLENLLAYDFIVLAKKERN